MSTSIDAPAGGMRNIVSVQPHGVLLAATSSDLTITHASQNSGELLGLEAQALLGLRLDAVFGDNWIIENALVLGTAGTSAQPLEASIGENRFDVIVHHSAGFVVLELEPSGSEPGYRAALAVYRAVHELTQATTESELWDAAARSLQQLTGFDRVIVSKIHPDGHREIVAEEAVDDMERHLGLRFPESDFPEQVRDTYLERRSRLIVSSTAVSSLVVHAKDDGPIAIDLERAELRSVTAHDVYFMRTLGHASILSLSLVRGGELIGVISLASRAPRIVPFSVRQGLESLANQVAMHQSSMAEIQRMREALRLRGIRLELTDRLVLQRSTDASAITGALLDGDLTMLDLIPADGAMICLGAHSASVGTTPPPSLVRAAVLQLGATLAGRSVVSGSLAHSRPDVAAILPTVSGLIVTPLPGFDGFLAWFRTEAPEQMNWFGEQPTSRGAAAAATHTSYPSWSQTTYDRSVPWAGLESEADDLARDITVALLQEADTQLAALAMRDALTGLPNRRLLMDRVEVSLARQGSGPGMMLLFVDLDAFKAVNDTYGHDAGDTLLVTIANRILSATRTADTVARLGGDEFVVFCDETTVEGATEIAERITHAIRQPLDVGGRVISITASVGLAMASEESSSASDLLKRADDAMYRAKARGRDRVEL